jgi:predicted Na+-dependent transporter
MVGVVVVVTALVCLGIGYYLGRRSGIEAAERRRLRD